MYNCLISLKNIYRLLTADDYPQYSYPVISRRFLHGVTLVRFWRRILPDRWLETPHGRVIWRTEGSKNRFHSELCNRKKNFSYYTEYTDEILGGFGAGELMQLDSAFISFLNEGYYNHEGFRSKLAIYLQMAAEQDRYFDEENAAWIQSLIEKTDAWGGENVAADARILSALCLHAIAGESMTGARIRRLHNDRVFEHMNQTAALVLSGSVRFLTAPDTLFSCTPGMDEPMYGRETQLFDLTEMLKEGGKYLICGTGGIGKTLLLGRLFAYNEQNRIYRRVALIKHEDSLKESFSHSFSGLTGTNAEERFHEALYILSDENGADTLLLVDDLSPDRLTEEEKEALHVLPCCIIATSRQSSLKGFTPYLLEPVDLQAAMLIFRHYYRHRISRDDMKDLETLFSEKMMTYPLMLRFFGEAAGNGRISIRDAGRFLSADPEKKAGRNRSFFTSLQYRFERIYRSAQLPENEDRYIRLFAVLPYAPYTEEWLAGIQACAAADTGEIPPDVSGESGNPEDLQPDEAGEKEEQNTTRQRKQCHEILRNLCSMGWLTEGSGGCSMHPVIADSVLAAGIRESDLDVLWTWAENLLSDQMLERICLRTYMAAENAQDRTFGPQQQEEIACIFYAGTRITGEISGRVLRLMALAACILLETGYSGEDMLRRLEKKAASCSEPDPEAQLLIQTCRIILQQGEPEKVYQMMQKTQPESRYLYLLCFLNIITGCITTGQPDLADQYIDIFMRQLDDGMLSDTVHAERIRTELIVRKGELLMMSNRYESALELLGEGLERALEEGRNAGALLCLIRMSEIHTFTQQEQLADEEIARAGSIVTDDLRWDFRMEYENALAWRAQQSGDWETALEARHRIREMMHRYLGRRSANYILATCNLGLTCARSGRMEESYRYHEEAVSLSREAGLQDVHRSVILNNAAVAYIEGERPEEALSLLEEAAKAAPAAGELAVAENRYNFSRCMRLMNRPENEKKYLQESLPAFKKIYGDRHGKTQYVMQRLEELDTT